MTGSADDHDDELPDYLADEKKKDPDSLIERAHKILDSMEKPMQQPGVIGYAAMPQLPHVHLRKISNGWIVQWASPTLGNTEEFASMDRVPDLVKRACAESEESFKVQTESMKKLLGGNP